MDAAIQVLPYKGEKKRRPYNGKAFRRGSAFSYRGRTFGYSKDGHIMIREQVGSRAKWRLANKDELLAVLCGGM